MAKDNIEKIVLNSFFIFSIIIMLVSLKSKSKKIEYTLRSENYIIIENLLVKINKHLIELYTKNYNYQLTHNLLIKNSEEFLKNDYINKITFVAESDELKNQLNTDVVLGKANDGEIIYTTVPNDTDWKLDTYRQWYYNAIGITEPTWSPVFFTHKENTDIMIIHYTIPIHNRSEEGGNAFLVNIEIISEIIKHVF